MSANATKGVKQSESEKKRIENLREIDISPYIRAVMEGAPPRYQVYTPAYDKAVYMRTGFLRKYAILRAAVAALIAVGISPDESSKRMHELVQARFPVECIRRRKIYPAQIASYISKIRTHREVADYSSDSVSAKTARQSYRYAEEFVTLVRKELRKDEYETEENR